MEYDVKYFSWLVFDSSEEEFKREIYPLFQRNQNEWILSKIENELKEGLKLYKEMTDENSNSELANISRKLSLFYKMKKQHEDKELYDSNLEKDPGKVKILFARNAFGNVMVESHIEDIKKLNDDKYGDLIELLKKLEAGGTTFNNEKQKMLSNNRNLKGIYELKGFQVRLIYMREKDYTIVIGAHVKKSDNDTKYQNALLNMRNKSEVYRNKVREGTLDFEEELEYSKQYLEQLVSSVGKGKQ